MTYLRGGALNRLLHGGALIEVKRESGQSTECGPRPAAPRANGGTVQFDSDPCDLAIVVRDHPTDGLGGRG